MPLLPETRLLQRSKGRITVALPDTAHLPPTEPAMIVFTSSTHHFDSATSGRWSFRGLFREMLNAWMSHNQRVADLGAGHPL
jgi:hypothetical protein